LDFSEEQKEAYIQMARLHHQSMVNFDQEEKKAIKSYLSYLTSKPDQGLSKEELKNLIESIEGEKLAATYEHFEELKGLCSEEQLKKIDTVIEKMVLVITRGGKQRPDPIRNE